MTCQRIDFGGCGPPPVSGYLAHPARAHTSHAYLAEIERGRRLASGDLLARIALVLRCSATEFVSQSALALNPPEVQTRRHILVDREMLLLPGLRACRRRGTRRRRW